MANDSSEQGGSVLETRARSAASSVLDAARDCLHSAILRPPAAGRHRRDLRASDALFRHLSGCVQEYARLLAELGRDHRTVLETILSVLDDAAYPDEPHPAVRMAVADWTLEALDAFDKSDDDTRSGGSAA